MYVLLLLLEIEHKSSLISFHSVFLVLDVMGARLPCAALSGFIGIPLLVNQNCICFINTDLKLCAPHLKCSEISYLKFIVKHNQSGTFDIFPTQSGLKSSIV